MAKKTKEQKTGIPQGIKPEQMQLLVDRLNHLLKLHPRIVGTLLMQPVVAHTDEVLAPYRGCSMLGRPDNQDDDLMLGFQHAGNGLATVSLMELLSACVDSSAPGHNAVSVHHGDQDDRGAKIAFAGRY